MPHFLVAVSWGRFSGRVLCSEVALGGDANGGRSANGDENGDEEHAFGIPSGITNGGWHYIGIAPVLPTRIGNATAY